MFARSPIKAGETVVIWSGTFVDREAAEGARADGKLIMQLDDNLYSVEERGEDPTYFMNHSCDPNVWMANAVTLVARRGIPSGAELTIDYALFEAVEDFEAEWECQCGSAHCRKRFTGKDWRIPELQERYAGHFLPLIIKRIADLR
jgi:SET domain-containing protein